jgi:hypothetical protein
MILDNLTVAFTTQSPNLLLVGHSFQLRLQVLRLPVHSRRFPHFAPLSLISPLAP